MLAAALILLILFCLSAILQWKWARSFERAFSPPSQSLTDAELPRVLVLLSLRGADPFLRNCILSLLRQDYPDYDVRIIVDNISDPAWKVAEDAIQEAGAQHATIHELQQPLGTCGLRINALLQQTEDLDPACEVVAWLDADTIPYPDWLQDMVRPFADQSVGATTGIRWYVPSYRNLGTLIRSAWNAAGAVQMAAFGMAFGGSLAYRAELMRDQRLRERWSKALWEDIGTRQTVEALGYQLAFVGSATLATRERISLKACIRFMSRQMLNVRLYHRTWPLIVAHSVLTAFGPLAVCFLCIAGIVSQQPMVVWLAVVGLTTQLAASLFSVLKSGFRARACVTDRGEEPWTAPWGMFPAVLLTPIVYSISVAVAMFAKQVTWRGITYRVRGPFEIEMDEYRPYQQREVARATAESL